MSSHTWHQKYRYEKQNWIYLNNIWNIRKQMQINSLDTYYNHIFYNTSIFYKRIKLYITHPYYYANTR